MSAQAPNLWKFCFVLATLAATVGCDQATKSVVRNQLPMGETLGYFHGTLSISNAVNRGAFLGLGEGFSDEIRWWMLTVAVSITLTGLLAFALIAPNLPVPRLLAIVAIVGGGLGNLIDRVSLGFVRDFVSLGIGPLHTGIFNIADMFITGGAVVLVVLSWRGRANRPTARSI